MRLINTETLGLEEFLGVVPKYAILSHTWEDGEVTLTEWQKATQGRQQQQPTGLYKTTSFASSAAGSVQERLPLYASPPVDDVAFKEALHSLSQGEKKAGYWKILKACFQARADGLGYLWVDTNCIDKTSSAELSEAINSMFAWYRDAVVCYAYLADVPFSTLSNLTDLDSPFRKSRWFTRGWTLQELIAPKQTEFFSAEWTRIATKSSLSRLVSEITRIDQKYLLKLDGIQSASVAQRMSWASNRITTRPEDIAYCLLGIFDVNMPLIYGEGSKAFIRLQEEIIKVSDDHSIFAWTWIPELSDALMRGKHAGYSVTRTNSDQSFKSQTASRPQFPSTRIASLRRDHSWPNPERPTLLAPDPSTFYEAERLPTLAPDAPVAPITITNAGLTITLPLLAQGYGDLVFAVLHQFDDRKSQEQTLICVPLVKHSQKKYRFTRTCFPPAPVTIKRQEYRSVGALEWTWSTLTPEEIHICRDTQHVPFYYNSFGGTAHKYGFWLLVPQGWKGFELVAAHVTTGGVFNEYGIFFDPSGSRKDAEVAGGLLIFRNTDSGYTLAVFLGRFFAPKYIGAPGHMSHLRVGVWARRPGDHPNRWKVEHRETTSHCGPEDLEQLFQQFSSEANAAPKRVAAWVDLCKVILHNTAPLSHAPDASVVFTELVF